jgi:hypothetical protein
MNKHTPGPWKINLYDDGRISIAAKYDIAGMYYTGHPEDAKANALLIAACPDMLEALKYVVRWHREHDSGEGELFGLDFVTACIATIAKAEGN